MNILDLIKDKDRVAFSNEFNYKTNFIGTSLFTQDKTDNLKVAITRLVEGGNIPVMANFHALDTEAKIGDRTNYRTIEVEKLLIKEKLNQTERIAELLGHNVDDQEAIDFIYDDMGNLISRVLTRAELANMQVLSTGKLTIDENNFKTVVDYGYPSANNTPFAGWNDPAHSIIDDLNAVIAKAKKDGKQITRALTSSKIVGYMVKNNEIKALFEKTGVLLTENRVLNYIYENFGIMFAVNDDVYKTSANDNTKHRFFPEDTITFMGGLGAIGKGFFGVTPEERALKQSADVEQSGYVTISQWDTPDPVATWTKASAMYIPVIADIEGIYITKISATKATA